MIGGALVLGLAATAAPCALGVVHPPPETPLEVAVPLGEAWVPAGSLVLAEAGRCAEGETAVRVVSVASLVRLPDPAVTYVEAGATGCLPAGWITSAVGRPLRVARPVPDRPAPAAPGPPGTRLAPPGREQSCDGPLRLADGTLVPLPEAASLSAPDAGAVDAAERVRRAYEAAFGQALGPEAFVTTPWGFVGLPLVHLRTPAEIEAAWAAEGLDTPERREKAVTDEGPRRPDGTPIYTHFTGADVRYSDLWAAPDTLVAVLGLLAAWSDHCVAVLGRSAHTCTVGIGDLAWYNGKLPDPLGHADHHEGTCVDLRLFRSDGSEYESWWNRPDDRPGRAAAYDPDLTAAFLAFALSTAPVEVAYFGDPAVIGAVPGVSPAPGHDDHLHLCFHTDGAPPGG